ncbi:nucleotidyltransferase family protein [Citreimonas sp.]|uniref:nucleotidyltransferase family protein n=1 Tax=Citreimonas sp. TaxID=3036715 RepID=UPI0040598705
MTGLRSDTQTQAALDAALAAWLGSGRPGDDVLAADPAQLRHRIDLNGAGPLLALKSDPAAVPDDIARFLRKRLVAREMWEEQHRRVLTAALDALDAAGLNPLVMKGTALAYSHYPRPAAWVRGDSDVLVEEEGRAAAFAALEDAGFRRAATAGGSTLNAEALFQRRDMMGDWHDIDLHWRLNSSPVLARVFSHAELRARSTPLPDLHDAAFAPGRVDALLFAAVHRRMHIDRPTHIHLNGVAHPVIDSLSWLMDIHLLFESLDRNDKRTVIARAEEKDISDILRDALRDARSRLGTHVPEDVAAALAPARRGRVTRYIDAQPARALVLNLAAMEGMRARGAALRERVFPPRDYMHARFSRGHADWLPILHLRRILPGVAKHLRRGREPS